MKIHHVRRFVVLDDASQHALQRQLRETSNSRLLHHAEQRGKHGHGGARESFHVHLTPRPVDFRTEEHGRLSVTMEHLAQSHVSAPSFGWSIQPDGQKPSYKTIGEGDEVLNTYFSDDVLTFKMQSTLGVVPSVHGTQPDSQKKKCRGTISTRGLRRS